MSRSGTLPSIAWCSLRTRLANPSSRSTTHPITANTIRLNAAGEFRITLEWDAVARCRHDAGMDSKYDVERPPARRGAESQRVSTRHYPGQESHAGGRGSTGAPSRVAQVGYSHPPRCSGMIGEILLQKSPKWLVCCCWSCARVLRSAIVAISCAHAVREFSISEFSFSVETPSFRNMAGLFYTSASHASWTSGSCVSA
jgi:hypothetical protein